MIGACTTWTGGDLIGAEGRTGDDTIGARTGLRSVFLTTPNLEINGELMVRLAVGKIPFLASTFPTIAPFANTRPSNPNLASAPEDARNFTAPTLAAPTPTTAAPDGIQIFCVKIENE